LNYDWKNAVTKKNSKNEEYVQVAFTDLDAPERLVYDKKRGYTRLPDEQLIGKKGRDGSTELFTMELIPTFEYARTHGVITMDSDFTGVQIIRDMDRKTVGTYHYAGGHLSITHNARVAEDYCEIRYKQRFHTHCSETASATAYAKDVYWNWTSFDGPVPQSPVPTGNPAGVNPWIECEDWVGEGFPEILSSTCSETTSPTPPGTPGTGGNGGYGQPWVGDQMTPQNFLQNYVLLGPKNPIDPSQKLDCFGTIPSDPKYKYSITLYVDQPYANTRKIANFSLEYNVERRPGHTYFGLERYDSSSGEIIRVVMGFYVQNSLTAMTGVYTGGAWGDDGGTDYDVSLKVDDITASDFKDIVYRLKSRSYRNITWWI